MIERWGIEIVGLEARRVRVTAECIAGDPGLEVVGVSAVSAKNLAQIVRDALAAAGAPLSHRVRATVNASRGFGLDLAVALAVADAAHLVPAGALSDWLLHATLGPRGELRPCAGAIGAAQVAQAAGMRGVLMSEHGARDAARFFDNAYYSHTLADVLAFARAGIEPYRESLVQEQPTAVEPWPGACWPASALWPLEVAAVGGHGLLLVGPLHATRVLAPRALLSLLPDPAPEDELQAELARSAAALDRETAWRRPLRAPHEVSQAKSFWRELALAHTGVLHLDHVNEFRLPVLDQVRCAQQSGRVRCAGDMASARFWLTATASVCPCGTCQGKPQCSSEHARGLHARRLTRTATGLGLDVIAPVPSSATATPSPENKRALAMARERVARALRQPAPDQAQRFVTKARFHWVAEPAINVAWTVARLRGVEYPSIDEVSAAIDLCARPWELP